MHLLQSFKKNLEESILVSFLDQHYMNELDELKYRTFKIPYEHFNSNTTIKLVSKAIFNLQGLKEVINQDSVLFYIESKTELNGEEFLSIITKQGFSFDTMQMQLKKLIEINNEIEKEKRINEI